MYQTVGHQVLELYAEAMDLPLYRATLQGTSLETGRAYAPREGDEVEDLYSLLKLVKEKESVDSVSVGAILSDYQRVRVENVCRRLGLQPLAFLWRRNQEELLDEMISCGVQAILIKVAAYGLDPEKHLGKTLGEMKPHLKQLSDQFGVHMCGEGGEYETATLDCPLFKKKIIVDSSEVVIHSNDAFAPVAYLRFLKMHLEDKVGSPAQGFLGECPCTINSVKEPDPYGVEELDDLQPMKWTFKGLPTVTSSDTVQSSSRTQGGFQWISGITASGSCVKEACLRGITSLNAQVQKLGLQMNNAVLVHLYVKNMEDFATINGMYGTIFADSPPARVCVQCSLPGEQFFLMDALFWELPLASCSEDPTPERISMHVQSISHWAPANIGPYSQAVRVGSSVFCAGQIALRPCTMQLVPGGITAQAKVSLHHVEQVLNAMSLSTCLSHVMVAHCYVTQASYIPIAVAAWRHGHTHQDSLPPLSVAVVPQLPRGALVEWHVLGAVSDSADSRHMSLFEEDTGLQATLLGVISRTGSSASLTLSLRVPSSSVRCQDWSSASNLMRKVLHRATGGLGTDEALTPLCCRAFCRCDGQEAWSLRASLQDLLSHVWEERSPVLILVPVMELPSSEVLHLSFWLSS
ncbi:diphthine--ammonia ligase isoform 2-T3 [Discoglossus pictus]